MAYIITKIVQNCVGWQYSYNFEFIFYVYQFEIEEWNYQLIDLHVYPIPKLMNIFTDCTSCIKENLLKKKVIHITNKKKLDKNIIVE